MSETKKKLTWYAEYWCRCKSEGHPTEDEVPKRCAEHDSCVYYIFTDPKRPSPKPSAGSREYCNWNIYKR